MKYIQVMFGCTYTHYNIIALEDCDSQNDGTRGFSIDQLKGKQLSPMFQPDALVVFRAKVALKMTRALSGRNIGESYFPLSWSLENPLVPSLLYLFMYQ